MGTELSIGADEPGRRVDDPLVEVRDLGLEPGAVSLDQVGRIGSPQGGEEERQGVDAVLEDVARTIEVVDRRRDVAPSPRPDVEGVGQRFADAFAVAQADQGRRREREVPSPEHVEVAGARGEGPAVPARLDARANDRGGVTDVAGVATELTTQADPDVVDVHGDEGRCDPGSDGHA